MENFDNEKNVLKFDLTSQQIKFKDILKKEFLELEVYAISDANPNRNGSHFTLESMTEAVESGSFKNKPIVGFFEKGDFTTHEGVAAYDTETQQEYWDTSKGERILGWIRESDNVEIVEKDGLHWIKFTCVLCVAYCYQQVKKLLKDRRKRVSVEVTVTKKSMNGDIMNIESFNLNGTTILGSKNGRLIMEGIAGAHASILDDLDDESMNEQKKVLSFAYQKIDGGSNGDKNSGTASPDPENLLGKEDAVMTEEQNSELNDCENAINFAEGKSCEGNKETNGEANSTTNEHFENCEDRDINESTATTHVDRDDDLQMKNENCCGENCGEANGECGSTGESGEPGYNNAENDNTGAENNCKMNDGEETELCKMQAKVAELEAKCAEYCETIAKMNEEAEAMKNSLCKMQDYEAREEQYAARADYDDIKARMETAEAKVHEYFCADLKATAQSLMSGEKVSKVDFDAIMQKCDDGKYSDKEEIKRDVAFAIYNARPVGEKQFSLPITKPETNRAVRSEGMTREQRIASRCKK